jgi:Glyoxalase-like domain
VPDLEPSRPDVRVGGIVFDCAEPRTVARFWRDAVGFRVRQLASEPEDLDRWPDDPDWVRLYDPEAESPTLGFQRVPEGEQNRFNRSSPDGLMSRPVNGKGMS